MLSSLLLMLTTSAAVLLVPASVGLLSAGRHAHMATVDGSTRRTRLFAASALVCLGSFGSTSLFGVAPVPAAAVATVMAGSVLAWWRLARSWAVRGVLVWSLAVAGTVGLVGWAAEHVLSSAGTKAELVTGVSGWFLLVLAAARLGSDVWKRIAERALRRPPTQDEGSARPVPRLAPVLAVAGLAIAVAASGTGLGEESHPPGGGRTSADQSGKPSGGEPSPERASGPDRRPTRSQSRESGRPRGTSTTAAESSSDAAGPAPSPVAPARPPEPSAPAAQPSRPSKTPGYAKDKPDHPTQAASPGPGRSRPR